MTRNRVVSKDVFDYEPIVSPMMILLVLLAITAGTLLAAVFLPLWLPGLTSSLLGEAPKVYWYLSRSSAVAAFALLWFSMAFGIMITNKMARLWPGGPAAFELHEYVSLLGLAFTIFHALILLGDEYIQYDLYQIFVPFASQGYRPLAVGLGQLGFYGWVFLVGSFYLRKKLGVKTWRLIHFNSYLAFLGALIHGIFSGTDSGTVWADSMYWVAGGSLLFLLVYRVLVITFSGKKKPSRQAAGSA